MGESNPKFNRETNSQTQASESLKDSQHTNHHFDAVKIDKNSNPNLANDPHLHIQVPLPTQEEKSFANQILESQKDSQTQDSQNFDAVKIDKNQSPNLLKRGEGGGGEFERGGKQTSPFMCPLSLIEKNLQAKNQTQDSQNFDAVKINPNQTNNLLERVGGVGEFEGAKRSKIGATSPFKPSLPLIKKKQKEKSFANQILESQKDSLFAESADSLISISKGITMPTTSQKGQEVEKTSKNTSIQAKSAKAPKLYRPLIASALATALGVSVAVANPTVNVGQNSDIDASSKLADLNWVAGTSADFLKPQSGSTDIENLNFTFTPGTDITGSATGSAYNANIGAGNKNLKITSNKALQIGATGTGTLKVDFNNDPIKGVYRYFTLDLSSVTGTAFKGNIELLSGTGFTGPGGSSSTITFGGSMEGNLIFGHSIDYESASYHNNTVTFNAGNLNGSIIVKGKSNNRIVFKQAGATIKNIDAGAQGNTTVEGENLNIIEGLKVRENSTFNLNIRGNNNTIGKLLDNDNKNNSILIHDSTARINLEANSKLTLSNNIHLNGGGNSTFTVNGVEGELILQNIETKRYYGKLGTFNFNVKSLTMKQLTLEDNTQLNLTAPTFKFNEGIWVDLYTPKANTVKYDLNFSGIGSIGKFGDGNSIDSRGDVGQGIYHLNLNLKQGTELTIAGNINKKQAKNQVNFALDSATLILNGAKNTIDTLTATDTNNILTITNGATKNSISTLVLGSADATATGGNPAKDGTLTLDTKSALTIGNLTVAGTNGTFIIKEDSTLPTINTATLDGGKTLTINNQKSGQNDLTISNFNVVGDNNIFRLESTATTNAISTLTLGAEATAESDTKNGTLTLENTRALNITTLKVENGVEGTLNLLQSAGDITIKGINLTGGTLTLNNEKSPLTTTLTTSGTSTLNLNKGGLIITTNPVSAKSGVSNTFNIGGTNNATLTLEQGFQSNGGGENKFFIKDSGNLILSNITSAGMLTTEGQGSLTHFDISAGATFDFNTYYNALTATNGGTNSIVSAKAITLNSVTADGGTNTITLKGGTSNIDGDITIDNSNQGKNKFTLEDSASLTLKGATNQITSLDILGTNNNTLTITDGATANSISTLTLGTATDGTLNLSTANDLAIGDLKVAHQSGTLNIDSDSQGKVTIGTATLGGGKTLTLNNASTAQTNLAITTFSTTGENNTLNLTNASSTTSIGTLKMENSKLNISNDSSNPLAITTFTGTGTSTLSLNKGGATINDKITAGDKVSNTFNIKSGATLTLTGGFETNGGKNKFVIESQGALDFGTGSGTSAPLTTAGTGSVTEFDIKSGANFNFGTHYDALEARDGGKNVVTSAVDVALTSLLASGNSAKNEITLAGNALTLDNISTTSGDNETTNTIKVKTLSLTGNLSANTGKNIITLGTGNSNVSGNITANGGQNLFTLAGTDGSNKSILTLNGANNTITTLDMQANSAFISDGTGTLTIGTLTAKDVSSTLTFKKGTNTITNKVENTQATFNVGDGSVPTSLTFSAEITGTGSVSLQNKAALTLNGGKLKSLSTTGTTTTNFAKGTTTITDGITAVNSVTNNINLSSGVTLTSAITTNGGTNNITLANNSNITGNITATSGTNSITLQGTTGDGTKATINGAMSGTGNSITLDSSGTKGNKTNLTLSGANDKTITNLTALSNDASSMNTLTIAENAKGANKIENLKLGEQSGTAKGFLTIDNNSGNALTIGTLTSAEAGNILTIGASEVIITNAVTNAGLSLKGATLTLNNANGGSTIASLATTGTNTINLNKDTTTIEGAINAETKNDFNLANSSAIFNGGIGGNGANNFKLDSTNGTTSLTLKGASNAITTLNALGNQNALTIDTGATGTNKIATLTLGTATGTATNGTLTLNAQKALTIDKLNVAHQSGTLGVDVSSREQITIGTTTLDGKTLTVNNAGQGQNQKTLTFTIFNATGKDNRLVLGNQTGSTSIRTLNLNSNILQIENNSPKSLAINAFTGTGASTLNLTKGGAEITGKITARNGVSNTFDIKSGATLTLTNGFETSGGTNAFIINAGGNLNFGSNDPFKDGLKTDSGTTSFIVKKGANFKFPNDKTIIAGASGINIIDTAETLNLGAITANGGRNEITLRGTAGGTTTMQVSGAISGTGTNNFTLDSTAGATALTLKGADNAIATLNALGNQNTLTIGAGANSTNTIKNLVLGDSKAKGLLTIANNATKDNSSNPLTIDTFESKFAESKLSISAGEVKITNALKGENNNITLSDNIALTLNGGKLKSLETAGTTTINFAKDTTTIEGAIKAGTKNDFNLTNSSATINGGISGTNNFKLDSASGATALTLKGASNAIATLNALGNQNTLTIDAGANGTNKIATLALGTAAGTATDGTLNLNTASALTIDSLNIINKSGTLNIDSASTGKTTIIKTALEGKTLTIDNSGSETLEISNFSTKGENTLNLTNTTNTSSTTTIGTLTMENKSKLNVSNDSTTNALKITAFKGTGTSTLALTKGKVEITNQVTAGSNTNNIFEISGNLTLAKGFSTSGGTNAFIINAGGNLNFGSNDPFKDGLKTDSGTTSFIVKKGANFKFPNDKTIIAGASGINIIDTAETLNLSAITANDTGKNEIALRNTIGTINGDIGGTGANHFTLDSATLVLKGANNAITTLNLAKETNSVIAFNKDLTIAKLSEMTGSTEKTQLTFINEIKKDEAELDKITYTAGRLVIDGSAINGSKTDDTQSQKLNGTYKMAIRGEETLPEEIEQTIKVATIKKHNGEGSGSTEDAQANLRSQGVIDLGAESVSVFTRGFTLKKFEYRVSETGADGEKGTGYITYSLGKQMEQDNVEQDILSNIALSATELYLANLNSLNKRMGELRDNNHSQGIWARVFNGQQSNNVNLKSSTNYTTVQVGYDYAFGFNAANNYLGFAFSYSHSQSDFKRKATSGDGAFASIDSLKSDLAEVALYNAYVADSGWYNDTIAKFSYLLNQVGLNTQDQLKSASHKGNVNTYAITLSNEIGYRVKFGGNKEWYIDPQAEVGFGYFEGKELNFSDTQFGVMDTLLILRGRVGTSFGYDFKSVAKEGINAQLYLGVFGEIDYFNGGDVKSEGGTTKWAINDPDIRAVLNVGTNLEVKNSTRIYFDFETSFTGKIKTDYKVNAGVRYSFGENANYKPINAVKKDAEVEKAPLKIEEKGEAKQEVKPAVEQEAQKAQAGNEAKKVEEKEVKAQEQAPKSEKKADAKAGKKQTKKQVAKKGTAKKQPAKKAEAKVEAKAETKQPALAQKAEAKPANNAKKQTNRTKKSGGGWGWW